MTPTKRRPAEHEGEAEMPEPLTPQAPSLDEVLVTWTEPRYSIVDLQRAYAEGREAGRGDLAALLQAAQDAHDLLSSVYVDTGRPEEPDATIADLRAALTRAATIDVEPVR